MRAMAPTLWRLLLGSGVIALLVAASRQSLVYLGSAGIGSMAFASLRNDIPGGLGYGRHARILPTASGGLGSATRALVREAGARTGPWRGGDRMPMMRLSSDDVRQLRESLRRSAEKLPFVPGPGFARAAETIDSWARTARAAEESLLGTDAGVAARLGGASVALRLMNRSIYSGRMDYMFGLGTYRGPNRTIRIIGTASQYNWDGRKFIHFDAIVGKPISYLPGFFDAGDLVRKVREWAEGSNRIVEVDPSVTVSGSVAVRDFGKAADRPESYLAIFFLKPGDNEKNKLEQLFYA